MTEIYRSRDAATVGIRTFFSNEALSTTATSIPEFAPAICILRESDVPRGVEIVRGYLELSEKEIPSERVCSSCGEASPGTFGECWNCGASLESPSDVMEAATGGSLENFPEVSRSLVRITVNASSREQASLALKGLPIGHGGLAQVQPDVWRIDWMFSHEGDGNVAGGDLQEDVGRYFLLLLEAKNIYDVHYEFHVVVGGANGDSFVIRPHMVAQIAALGGALIAHRIPPMQDDTAKIVRV